MTQDIGHAEPLSVSKAFDFGHFGRDIHKPDNLHLCTVRQSENAKSMQIADVQNERMSEDSLREAARSFMAAAVEASGLRPSALAKKAGVAPSTLTRPLGDPDFAFTPKHSTLLKIAQAAGLDLPDELGQQIPPSPPLLAPVPEMLPVLGRVQAGAWLAVDGQSQVPPREVPAVRDPRFPNAKQWLLEVVGNSVDKLEIREGDLVHCIDAIDAGYFPKTGDIVQAERLRFDDSEVEVTIKQVEITEAGVVLMGRSSNPAWNKPLSVTDGAKDGEEISVRIRGFVVGLVRRF